MLPLSGFDPFIITSYNGVNFEIHIHQFKFSEVLWKYLDEEKTFDGVSMKVYTIDRLICDVLKYEERMEHEDFRKAVLAYIADRKKDVEKLTSFAAERKVSRKVRDMIGVWL